MQKMNRGISVALVCYFLLLSVLFVQPFSGDGDFFHHMNTGRYIWEHHALPYTDEYTFTARGLPWVSYAWGTSVIYYAIYHTVGAIGINMFGAIIGLLTFVLLYHLLRGYCLSVGTTLLFLSLGAPAMASRWPNRPEIMTYPLVSALLLINQCRLQKPRLVALLPLLILLWANLYGASVFVGLFLLLLFAFFQLVTDRFKIRAQHTLFWGSVLVSFPLSLVNGYGLRSLLYIFFIPEVAKIQGEWAGIIETLQRAPIIYTLVFQYRVLLYLLYLVTALVIALASLPKMLSTIRRAPIVAVAALGILVPWVAFRHLGLAVTLSLPLVGIGYHSLGKTLRYIALSIVLLVTLISLIILLWTGPPGVGEDPDIFPPSLVAFLKENTLAGRTYNSQAIGGFLTYYLYPNVLVYSDTRDDLFLNTHVLGDFFTTAGRNESILPLLSRYQVDLVVADLAEGPSYQPLFYSIDWSPVYVGSHYAVFVRPAVAKEKNLFVYGAIDPFHPTGAKVGSEQNAALQYERLLPIEPNTVNTGLRLASVLTAMGNFDEAIAMASRVRLNASPRLPMFAAVRDYILAQAYFGKNDCRNTKHFLDAVKNDSTGKIIFRPDKPLPTLVNKGYTFYYLLCEKNSNLARSYLDRYLSQPDVEPGEKLRTSNQFNELEQRP